jgi:hypothetical protein
VKSIVKCVEVSAAKDKEGIEACKMHEIPHTMLVEEKVGDEHVVENALVDWSH